MAGDTERTAFREVPEAELWICGGGDDQARLAGKCEELKLEGVSSVGRLSDRELALRYRTASIFCMPSRQEGFGLVYAEAMWHGLPCIGSTSDGAGTVIEDGRTGFLVPYGDAEHLSSRLVELLKDPERARSMGAAGRARVEGHFTHEAFAARVRRALEPEDGTATSEGGW